MSIVVLDSFERDNSMGEILREAIKNKRQELSYYKLKDMNIKRCRACNACAEKTPGVCAIKDDMQQVFKDIAKCEYLIMLTPLRFGGFSSLLKLAVDRFMVLGLPFYYVKEGKLFHKTRYGHKNYIGVALIEDRIPGQEENFRRIVKQNADNLSYTGKTLIFTPEDDINKIEKEFYEILGGADN